MAKKHKPIVNKMYEWNLEVDGQLVSWKCFVGEDECITYEGDRECKRLKIVDKTQAPGVLQIDCETRVWDDIVPFQLENGVPYIKILGEDGKQKWIMSDTTKEDRLQAQIRKVKKEAYMYFGIGVLVVLFGVAQYLIKGTLGEWPIAPILATMFFVAGALNLIRLRNELSDMGRQFSFKL